MGLFDSRLLIEKNKVKLNNFELVKNNLFENLKVNPENKILILREQGIGEKFYLALYIKESSINLKILKLKLIKDWYQYLIDRFKMIYLLKMDIIQKIQRYLNLIMWYMPEV